MSTFQDLGLRREILEAITELGYESPTPIQKEAIPQVLNSKQDLIALAQTGTGKTAAFGLPILNQVVTANNVTQAIILCPTRELCLQISRDLESYSKKIKGLRTTAVYGGTSIDTQIRALNKGAHIVVGTPGRVIDLIYRRKLQLQDVEYLVLDEADEMLSMGFKDDLDTILAETPDDKQTLLFSATMPKEISKITKKYMHNPYEIEVARRNTSNQDIDHEYYMVQAKDRYLALKRLADINPNIYGIVFCRTRRETKEVADKLMHDGYNADALHGDLSQAQRDLVMNKFRKKHLQILVATDVAARGLDVNELTHVINYNLPDDPEVYVHRSGRTGRAGNKGKSITIVHTREMRRVRELEKMTARKFEQQLVPNGEQICEVQLMHLIENIKNTEVDQEKIGPFMPAVMEKLSHLDKEELIKHFVSAEFNRFLEYYKNAPDLNRNIKPGKEKEGRDRKDRKRKKDIEYTRFFINAGRGNKLTPQRLMGMINDYPALDGAEIGAIDIQNNFSFFEIETGLAEDVVPAFENKDLDGFKLNVELSVGSSSEMKPRRDRGSRRFGSPRSEGRGRRERGGSDRERNNRDGGGSRSGRAKSKGDYRKKSSDSGRSSRSGDGSRRTRKW